MTECLWSSLATYQTPEAPGLHGTLSHKPTYGLSKLTNRAKKNNEQTRHVGESAPSSRKPSDQLSGGSLKPVLYGFHDGSSAISNQST